MPNCLALVITVLNCRKILIQLSLFPVVVNNLLPLLNANIWPFNVKIVLTMNILLEIIKCCAKLL